MAKMEQFPEPPGEMKTEETTKERAEDKTEVPAGSRSRESVPDGKTKRMPDDSLLMGRNTAKDSAKSGKGKDEKGADPNGEAERTSRPRAKVHKFSVHREERDPDVNDGTDYKELIRQHRWRRKSLRILAAVLVGAAIILFAVFWPNRHYYRAEIRVIREFISEEGAQYTNFNGHVLQYGPNGVTCANADGKVKWSITYEMDQPMISISGDVAAIADYGGRTIYVMNTDKQMCTISTGLPIHKIAASECGEVAAVLDDNKTTWIRLYSKKGKEIAYFVRSMEENGYPMDVAVSPDGTLVCISSFMLKDSSATSCLSFYDFGKAGKDYPQHLVGNFEYKDEVFPYVRFMGNDVCAAASDARFVVFDTSRTEPQNSINNMLTENLQGIFAGKKYIGLLFTDLTRENLYRLDIFGKNGKKEGSVGFTMAFNDIQIVGNRVYINNEQSMQIFTLEGREIFNGGFDRMVKQLIPSEGIGGLTAVSENEIDAVILR